MYNFKPTFVFGRHNFGSTTFMHSTDGNNSTIKLIVYLKYKNRTYVVFPLPVGPMIALRPRGRTPLHR